MHFSPVFCLLSFVNWIIILFILKSSKFKEKISKILQNMISYFQIHFPLFTSVWISFLLKVRQPQQHWFCLAEILVTAQDHTSEQSMFTYLFQLLMSVPVPGLLWCYWSYWCSVHEKNKILGVWIKTILIKQTSSISLNHCAGKIWRECMSDVSTDTQTAHPHHTTNTIHKYLHHHPHPHLYELNYESWVALEMAFCPP